MSAISSSPDVEIRQHILVELPSKIIQGMRDGLSYRVVNSSYRFDPFVDCWKPLVGGSAIQPGGSLSVLLNERAGDFPPDSNTGGKWLDDAIIKGGKSYPIHIDALTFTLPGWYLDCDIGHARKFVERFSGGVLSIGGGTGRRFNGYQECWQIVFADGGDSDGKLLGWLGTSSASDAQRGRWCFCLSGLGCCMIRSWIYLADAAKAMNGRITRCDIALDDLDGDYPVKEVYKEWKAGSFGINGRPPKCQAIWNSDGSGNTVYIGSRVSGKMSRHYEKGRQLGDIESKWVRHEVELLSKDRVIPWDVLINPGSYLEGAYPRFFSWVCSARVSYIKTIKQKVKISLKRLFNHGRQQVGTLINYCRDKMDMDDSDIISKLLGKSGKYPREFIEDIRLPMVDDYLEKYKLKSIYDLAIAEIDGYLVRLLLPNNEGSIWVNSLVGERHEKGCNNVYENDDGILMIEV